MQRILVALDHSPRAPQVLKAALSLASPVKAKLYLYRAAGLPMQFEIPPEVYSIKPDDLPRILQAEALRGLETLAQTVPPELLAGTEATIDSPWEGICQAAKRHDVDLVVLGTHGFSGLDRVLGTTAAKVVNHADRNVLVVRASERV